MGNRLTKIYTKTGDDGSTGLGDGTRVAKTDMRVESYGTVDELNSHLGMLRTLEIPAEIDPLLLTIQHRLFDLGGELSIPGMTLIQAEHVTFLEHAIDHFNANLPVLKEFILPGGNLAASVCHVARTVCRRAERCVVALKTQQAINLSTLHFLNRLSDLLFVLARVIARQNGGNEVYWQHERK